MISSRFLEANGLRLHCLDSGGEGDPVLLLHGYLDLAATFHAVIGDLARAGYRVVAPDFRGHGDSDRCPRGSYYHFPDYLADVVGLLDALALDRVHVVAHSMGGSVATSLAAVLPERVRSLALLEGVGPLAMPAEVAPDRTLAWLQGVDRVRGRAPRRFASLDEVVARMRTSHPGVPDEVLRDVGARSVRETADGGYVFRFDPLHQTTAPNRFDADAFCAFIERVRCPVLLVDGGSGAATFPELAERGTRYPGARTVVLDGAGHMMHWTRGPELAAALAAFLRSVA